MLVLGITAPAEVLKAATELRSCVKVEVAVLDSHP